MKARLLFLTLILVISSCKAQHKTKVYMDGEGTPEGYEVITLGGGCFWCIEAVFQQIEGVYSATSGYMGGEVKNPTYEQVCGKKTGHIEVVQIVYDPQKLPLDELLDWFWAAHDATQKDGQGGDIGPQYASVIFYQNEEQRKTSYKSMERASAKLGKKFTTTLQKAEPFYSAEDYHQNFYDLNKNRNSYCRYVIEPKLDKLKLTK